MESNFKRLRRRRKYDGILLNVLLNKVVRVLLVHRLVLLGSHVRNDSDRDESQLMKLK